MLTIGDFHPTSVTRRRRLIVASTVAAAASLLIVPAVRSAPGGDDPRSLPELDTQAAQVTAIAPHVVVYSVPTKKHHGGDSGGSDSSTAPGESRDSGHSKHSKHSKSKDSGDSGSSSGDSGSGQTSVSNTVNGSEVGGAKTYNNHHSSGLSNSSPVQLENNTGAGAAALDPGYSSDSPAASAIGSGSAVASAVMFMRVACPAAQAAGTVCFQATSSGGEATSMPATPTQASTSALSDLSSVPSSAPAAASQTVVSGPSSTSSAAGQVVEGATTNLSQLESKSGKKIELTGYSYQDNQGGNNAKISCPQVHQQAGGTGTYGDPITVASGGKSGGASADGVKCGDRFYIPAVQRYVIVEDTGNTPNKSMPHLDMYVADDPGKKCMNSISGTVTAIPNPPQGLPVLAGPIGNGGSCKLPSGGGR